MEISIKIQKTITIDEEEISDTMQLKAQVLNTNTCISPSHQHQELIVTSDVLEDGLTLHSLTLHKGSTLQLLLFPTPKPTINLSITSLTHETLTLESEPSATIKTIKTKIHHKIKVPIHLQELFFAEKQLENPQTLVDYKIASESTLVLKVRGEMRIFVKTNMGDVTELGVKSSDSVDHVKEKVRWKMGSVSGTEGLVFAGKRLDGQRSLGYYGIGKDSTLELGDC